jgi:integrase
LLQGKFRFRFHKAREAAKKHIDALAVELGVEKLRELGLEWFPFQFRDLRPKAATDKERSAGMAETRRFLGHTTERQTADYVRDKIGELTDPVSASPPEWMAKVLSPKTQSSA